LKYLLLTPRLRVTEWQLFITSLVYIGFCGSHLVMGEGGASSTPLMRVYGFDWFVTGKLSRIVMCRIIITVLESWIISFYVSWMWMWNPITPLAMESSEMVASFAISRHSDRMCFFFSPLKIYNYVESMTLFMWNVYTTISYYFIVYYIKLDI
jgi:hypothetical protein